MKDERRNNSLIAREKYDKQIFWMCAGIIGVCHSILLINFIWFILIPMVFAIFTLICDNLSNIIYIIISDYTDKTNIPNKNLNIYKLIFAFITLITFLITYLIYITS